MHCAHRQSMHGGVVMRQTELRLTEEDRSVVDEFRGKGTHQSREVNRAHFPSALDRGVSEAQIMALLGMGRTAVWRTRAAYLQGDVELAVFDVARTGRPTCQECGDARSIAPARSPAARSLPVPCAASAGRSRRSGRWCSRARGGERCAPDATAVLVAGAGGAARLAPVWL